MLIPKKHIKWYSRLLTIFGTAMADYHGEDRETYGKAFMDGAATAESILALLARSGSIATVEAFVAKKIEELQSGVSSLKSRRPYKEN